MMRVTFWPTSEIGKAGGQRFRIMVKRVSVEMKETFFTQKVLSSWNALPVKVIEAGSLTVCKECPDEHLDSPGIEGAGPCSE